MKKILLSLFLFASLARAVDTLSVPTDFNSVTTGTRANLSGNFTAIQTWGNKVRDSIAQVTAHMGGYTGNLLVSSLSNLRLKLDADNSETARLLVESGNGDSLFTVREDTTARFYKHLTVDSNLTVNRKLIVADSVRLTLLTASLPVVTDAQKHLASATVTGTGTTVVLSASPTISGTLSTGKITSSDSVKGNFLYTSGSLTALGDGTFQSANSGDNRLVTIENQSNTASSGARLLLKVAGTSAADPFVDFIIAGGGRYTLGADNSVGGDPFTIAASGSLQSSRIFTLSSGGSAVVTGSLTADSLISAKFYEEGTFTATITGMTAGVTGTASYVRVGKTVTLLLPSLIGTSNTTACTVTGLPPSIQTTSIHRMPVPDVIDNGNDHIGFISISGGTITLAFYSAITTLTGTFTGSGLKGLNGTSTVSYTRQ